MITEALFLSNPIVTSYPLKRLVLRAFGASIGRNVIIKPGVKIKYPWRLTIGDSAWIGERAWLDNMEDVEVGPHAVISQGAYVCTGNHDWGDPGMGLVPAPVGIGHGAWVAAFARVGPGVRVASNSVVALGAVLLTDTEPSGVYAGNPATRVATRVIREHAGPPGMIRD
jgi:putative colanic acid biosynthesis acetyltransferase WcaF